MELTREILIRRFDELNRNYFGGKLVTPVLRVNMAKSRFGTFTRVGKVFTITISDYYERSLHDIDNTLLHEMIHLKLSQLRIKDNTQHGKAFMREARRLNREGWDIRARNPVDGLKPKRTETYHLLAIKTRNGRCYIMRYSPKMENRYKLHMMFKSYVHSYLFFTSTSNEYSSLRECRTGFYGKEIPLGEYKSLQLRNASRLAV